LSVNSRRGEEGGGRGDYNPCVKVERGRVGHHVGQLTDTYMCKEKA